MLYPEIQEQFKKVIAYSQEWDGDINTEELFEKWYKAKSKFIAVFDDLIWYGPQVEFTLDEESKQERITNLLGYIWNRYRNEELYDFIEDNRDNFFDNITKIDYTVPNSKEVIKAGTKIIKAFKYFEPDKEILNDIQSMASRIIQENKLHGQICLSIHPLDFLSSSENTYNWRSCHALDGEFKVGNLSYMLDTSTFMVYLRSEEEVRLPNFPEDVKWNSKKWRRLMHFSNDSQMLIAGRPYPCSIEGSLEYITKEIFPQVGLIGWKNCVWHNKKIKNFYDGETDSKYEFASEYIPVGYELRRLGEVVRPSGHALNYNDIVCSSVYSACYTYKPNYWAGPTGETNEMTKFLIGEDVPCLGCGETLRDPEEFFCPDCVEKYNDRAGTYCTLCGRRIIRNQERYDYRDGIACLSCYDNYIVRCDICNQLVPEYDLYFNELTGEYECYSCREHLQAEEVEDFG